MATSCRVWVMRETAFLERSRNTPIASSLRVSAPPLKGQRVRAGRAGPTAFLIWCLSCRIWPWQFCSQLGFPVKLKAAGLVLVLHFQAARYGIAHLR